MRKLFTGIAVVFALLVVVALGFTQVLGQSAPQKVDYTVLSGSDIGFRIESRNGNRVSGQFMVKVDGRWVEAQPSARIMPVR